MPNTLIPIQTFTLTGTTTSVTFSNIPQTYTDLKLVVSARKTGNSVDVVTVTVNGGGTAINANKYLDSNNTGTPRSGSVVGYQLLAQPADYTASTFDNSELYIPNYTGSNNKTLLGETVLENNASGSYLGFTASTWPSSSAITSLTLTPNASSFASGSTFTLYGISNGVKATGGTLTVAGGYAYHTFTSTGTFTPTQQIKGAELLVVAGGGAGGYSNNSGGGGAGGLLYRNSQTLIAGNVYTAIIGAGGVGQAVNTSAYFDGASGNNSVFGSLTAIGGGGGAGGNNNTAGRAGKTGGSAGGSGFDYSGTPGQGTVGQGNNGGIGSLVANGYGAGGGGGAGGVGQDGTGSKGGDGGVGAIYNNFGLATGTGQLVSGNYYYAGGGAGAQNSGTSAGGFGGGGWGGYSNSLAAGSGTANTGGGGGGVGNSSGGTAGSGGSGLIIVRYPLN